MDKEWEALGSLFAFYLFCVGPKAQVIAESKRIRNSTFLVFDGFL